MRDFGPVIAIGGLLILFSAALRCEEPAQVMVRLKVNPADYNHKLIEVIGFVSHGFEDFGFV